LELVSPETLKAQALTGASLVGRRRRLKALAAAAASRVQELCTALDRDDPIADERHARAARGHTAQQEGVHVNAALAQMKKFSRTRAKKPVLG
jgi:hypothetical protein